MESAATIIRKNRMQEKESKRKNDQTIDDEIRIWASEANKTRHMNFV